MTYTMPQNITGTVPFIQWADTTVGGWFGSGILVALWAIVFFSTKEADVKRAFATASFLTALVAVMLRALEFISDQTVIFTIIFAAIAMLWLVWDKD
jgi:hypothetical protein